MIYKTLESLARFHIFFVWGLFFGEERNMVSPGG
jgi:hypothetical protein